MPKQNWISNLAASATLATQSATAFPNQDGGGGQGRNCIGPCEVKDGIHDEPTERDQCKVGAGGGLDGIGGEHLVGRAPRELALLPRQLWHDKERRRRDEDSERAGPRFQPSGQGQNRGEGDNRRKREEQNSGGTVDCLAVDARSQGEDDKYRGEKFD